MGKAAVVAGVYLVGLIVLCVALGFVAGSVWVGLLVFAGVFVVHIGFNRATSKGTQSAIWIAWLGIAGIYYAAQLAQYAGQWLWSVPWALSAILMVGAAAATFRLARLVSVGFLMLGGLCGVMGVLGPLALYGLDEAATAQVLGQWLWVWVLLIGLVTLVEAVLEARADEPVVFVGLVVVGIVLMAVGTWLGRDANPWAIAPVWMAGAALTGYGSWTIREDSQAAGWAMLAASGAALVAAIAAPIMLSSGGAGPDAVGVGSLDPGAWVSATASAMWDVARSGWGVLHIAVSIVLGMLWSRRFGGIVALLALIGVVGATAGVEGGGASAVLSESPASLLQRVLSASSDRLGSPGWGALVLGAGLALVVLPSVGRGVVAQVASGTSGPATGPLGASIRFGRLGQSLDGPTAALALVHPGMLIGLIASLWIGLQGLPAVTGSTAFLGIPDITLPSFWPVWDVSYFLLALVIGAATASNQQIYRRMGLRGPGPRAEPIGWLAGSLVIGLFVPAGVLLFLLAHNLLIGAATVVAGSRVTGRVARQRAAQRRRPEDEEAEAAVRAAFLAYLRRDRGVPAPEPEAAVSAPRLTPRPRLPQPPEPTPLAGGPAPDAAVTADAAVTTNVVPPPKSPPGTPPVVKPTRSSETVFAGDTTGATKPGEGRGAFVDDGLLYRSPEPLIDLLQVGGGDHLLLRQDGRLARWHLGRLEEVPGVVLRQPIGLATGKGGEVIAADGARRLVGIRLSNGARPEVSEHQVDVTIGCFAVNPFGTIAAFAPVRRPDVLAVILATGAQQMLAEGVGSVTAMAFSANGRHLALGLQDGRVRLLDMSTRRTGPDLAPPAGESGKIVSLAHCPDSGWVAAYEGGRLAEWDQTGTLTATREEAHHLSSVAVCEGSGRVAVGSTDGHVLVHSAHLGRPELDAHTSADEVVRVAFEPGRESLVSAGRDGTVRRAAL